LAWGLLPEGSLKSAAFVLATTSWVATLAINASPFMRFDGYFILMDALDMPNLHGRSFALARWKLREWLFGLGDAPPEYFSPGQAKAMVAFAWATWLYRLVLFLGIALLVYFFFFKLLGVLLFVVEIAWFIWWPIRSELRVWGQLWPRIRQRQRSHHTAWLALFLLLLVVIPWPGRIGASAVLRPQETWPVFAPAGARIEALPLHHGAHVEAGQPLVELFMPDLVTREKALQAKLDQQRWQAVMSVFDDEMRKRMKVSEQSLATTNAELQGIQAERTQFAPTAPFAGHFWLADPDLRPGQWISKREALGVLVRLDSSWRVETWLYEDDVQRVQVGQKAFFTPDSGAGEPLRLTVSAIDRDASRILPRHELAGVFGGHILTREKNGMLVPERSIYRVVFEVNDMPPSISHQTWRGQLTVHADWSSPVSRYTKQALSVLVREFGF
jgi:putative peptide zinc metalloprotease protein